MMTEFIQVRYQNVQIMSTAAVLFITIRSINELCIGGVPLDGSPKTVIRTFNIGLVVVFDTLATLGIAFAVLCLLFNFIFRKRK